MRGIFDFTNDTVVAWGVLYDDPQYDAEAFEVPDDYSPERYDYIPAVAGVYDPNGFTPKPPLSPGENPTPCPYCNRV